MIQSHHIYKITCFTIFFLLQKKPGILKIINFNSDYSNIAFSCAIGKFSELLGLIHIEQFLCADGRVTVCWHSPTYGSTVIAVDVRAVSDPSRICRIRITFLAELGSIWWFGRGESKHGLHFPHIYIREEKGHKLLQM